VVSSLCVMYGSAACSEQIRHPFREAVWYGRAADRQTIRLATSFPKQHSPNSCEVDLRGILWFRHHLFRFVVHIS